MAHGPRLMTLRSQSTLATFTAGEVSTIQRKANTFLNAHEGASRHADSVK
jgi:hypothetical protein